MSRVVNLSFLAGRLAGSPVCRLLVSIPSVVVPQLSRVLSSVACPSATSINSIRPFFSALISPSLKLDYAILLKRGSKHLKVSFHP